MIIEKKRAQTSLQFWDEKYGKERAQNKHLEMLDRQRKRLHEIDRLEEFDEELIRKYLKLIDVEEFKIREKQFRETGSHKASEN